MTTSRSNHNVCCRRVKKTQERIHSEIKKLASSKQGLGTLLLWITLPSLLM